MTTLLRVYYMPDILLHVYNIILFNIDPTMII